jgi:serine O-acetyltransferase
MIKNRQDYLDYLEADRVALGVPRTPGLYLRARRVFFPNYIWSFVRLLRRAEYHHNCGHRLGYILAQYRLSRLSLKLGLNIPINCFGPGLDIPHTGGINVNSGARIGCNCKIYPGVTIGETRTDAIPAPRLGDNVHIGAGAAIIGDIDIADDIAIGANAVVVHSFAEPGITLAGVPARKVSDKGTKAIRRQ